MVPGVLMTMSDLTITILVDNQAGDGLLAEHGLALWIQIDGRRILFDSGQGAALPVNAERLGIDLSTADTLVLSHGHYDHGGGIPAVLGRNRDIAILAHPRAVRSRFVVEPGKVRPVHLPVEALAALDRHPTVRWVRRVRSLGSGIGLTGPIPRGTPFEDPGGPFFLDPAGRLPDAIDDEMALWIRTSKGLVVCTGCAHAGLINTLHLALRQSGEKRITAVIGGFHLGDAGAERLAETVAALRDLAVERLVPCHCTGRQATEVLQAALGDRLIPGQAGAVFRFPL
jgi:7,8-dihydropterin-6-yl-methyl-4-(beta-D-ribofuranosyl)aminobenzene 5'-phosphate synthase